MFKIFEYPKKSGHWYKGAHQPLISKELFEKVQLERKKKTRQTTKKYAIFYLFQLHKNQHE